MNYNTKMVLTFGSRVDEEEDLLVLYRRRRREREKVGDKKSAEMRAHAWFCQVGGREGSLHHTWYTPGMPRGLRELPPWNIFLVGEGSRNELFRVLL